MPLEEQSEVMNICFQKIPTKQYYLSFTLVLVSMNSHRIQFLSILDNFYKEYTLAKKHHTIPIEVAINRIVFGIPNPPKRYDLLVSSENPYARSAMNQKIVKVMLTSEKSVYIKNNYHFEIFNQNSDSVCTVIKTMSAEIILQLFKRLLFNTCNILVCRDQDKLKKCILGIIELFYPLTIDLVSIPVLPETLIEYVSLCDYSIIGIV